MAILHLPVQMSDRAGCASHLQCEGDSVGAVLNHAIGKCPALHNKIYATPGRVNRYLRIFIDGEICLSDVHEVKVRPSSEIRILMALAGG